MLVYTARTLQFQEGNVSSLWYFLHQVRDHRDPRGRDYPLPVVLTLAVLALCCGRKTYEDIASWCRDYQEALQRDLPFLSGHLPVGSTFYRIFADLDTDAFEAVIASWVAVYAPAGKGDGISIDGKTTAGDTLHAVAAFAHKAKSVLFQQTTNTKGKELVLAPKVLAHIPLAERMLTGDALYTQTKICAEITRRGGGYVFTVKENQELLKKDIEQFFSAPPWGSMITQASTAEKSHGRIEERRLELSRDLTDYLDWPGVTHVFRCTRSREEKGKQTTEVVVGIARLLPGRDTAAEVLAYLRGHWGIENRLHRQRDVVFGEDASTIRKRNAPHTMAILRNIVTTFLHQYAKRSFTQTMHTFAAKPTELFTTLGLSQWAYLYR